MIDSGDTSRLPQPPVRPSPPPTNTGSEPNPRGSHDNPTWLTESAYARPITDESGRLRRPDRSRGRTWLRRLFFIVVFLIPVSVLLVGSGVYFVARNATPHQADAIVVLGAAQYNGRPSEVFQARLDHTLQLYEEGYAPLIVVTGGKMPGDAYTEAETAQQYLVDRGVPASVILIENEGRDTWASMQGVSDVLQGTDVESLLIVSDGFHLLRSELMARDLGFTAYGSGAPDSPIEPWSASEFSYVIRETGGIFVMIPRLLGLS